MQLGRRIVTESAAETIKTAFVQNALSENGTVRSTICNDLDTKRISEKTTEDF